MSIWLSLFACGGNDSVSNGLEHRSTLRVPALGLALFDDGEAGRAGMYASSCPFATQNGQVTGDYDIDGDSEAVTDGGTSAIGAETAVLVEPFAVHLIDSAGVEDLHETFDVAGATDARLAPDGVVALTRVDGVCALVWPVSGVSVDVACGPIDTTAEGSVVVGGDAVVVVAPDGTTGALVDERADWVVVDDSVEAVYTARKGVPEVRAWDFDGTPRWTAELDDAVVALEHGGTQGIAIVSISDDEGGRVVMLDGWTGLVIEEVATPSVVPGFAVSRDGSTLALVLDDETHFYDLLPGR
jgi:hypothetical protein